MRHWKEITFGVLVTLWLAAAGSAQQNIPDVGKAQGELGIAGIYLTPMTATGAVAAQTTLTIPAPPAGLFNYVCKLDYNASQDGAVTVGNVQTAITSTNFNSWAWKYSLGVTINLSYDKSFDFGTPATGCAKSTSPGVVTTFVSPAGSTDTAFTFAAAYYQAK